MVDDASQKLTKVTQNDPLKKNNIYIYIYSRGMIDVVSVISAIQKKIKLIYSVFQI